jgi:hypothetical protein
MTTNPQSAKEISFEFRISIRKNGEDINFTKEEVNNIFKNISRNVIKDLENQLIEKRVDYTEIEDSSDWDFA